MEEPEGQICPGGSWEELCRGQLISGYREQGMGWTGAGGTCKWERGGGLCHCQQPVLEGVGGIKDREYNDEIIWEAPR